MSPYPCKYVQQRNNNKILEGPFMAVRTGHVIKTVLIMISDDDDDSTETASEYIYSSDSEGSYHLLDREQNLAVDDAWYSNRPETEEYSDLDVEEEAATASTVSYNVDPGDFEVPSDSDQSDSGSNADDSDPELLNLLNASYNSDDEDSDWNPNQEYTRDGDDDSDDDSDDDDLDDDDLDDDDLDDDDLDDDENDFDDGDK